MIDKMKVAYNKNAYLPLLDERWNCSQSLELSHWVTVSHSLPDHRLPQLVPIPWHMSNTIKLTLLPADCINRINEPIKSHMISSFLPPLPVIFIYLPPGHFVLPVFFMTFMQWEQWDLSSGNQAWHQTSARSTISKSSQSVHVSVKGMMTIYYKIYFWESIGQVILQAAATAKFMSSTQFFYW